MVNWGSSIKWDLGPGKANGLSFLEGTFFRGVVLTILTERTCWSNFVAFRLSKTGANRFIVESSPADKTRLPRTTDKQNEGVDDVHFREQKQPQGK